MNEAIAKTEPQIRAELDSMESTLLEVSSIAGDIHEASYRLGRDTDSQDTPEDAPCPEDVLGRLRHLHLMLRRARNSLSDSSGAFDDLI